MHCEKREAKHNAVFEVSDPVIPEMNVWRRIDQYHGDLPAGSTGLILGLIEGGISAPAGLFVAGESPPRSLLHLRSRECRSPTADAYVRGDACCFGR